MERNRMRWQEEEKQADKVASPPKKFSWWKAIRNAGIFTGVLLAYSSAYVVDQTEHVVVTQFGNPKRVVHNPIDRGDENKRRIEEVRASYRAESIPFSVGPGLYFKVPVIQSVDFVDNRLQPWNGYPEQIATLDKRYIWADPTARVYVDDPLAFMRKIRTEESMHGRLDGIIDPATRNAVSNRPLIEVVRSSNRRMLVTEKELEDEVNRYKISEGRPRVVAEITERAQRELRQYGIALPQHGVLFKDIVYVEAVRTDVEKRMVEERKRIAAVYRSEGEGEYHNITGKKDKQVKMLMSEAYKTAKEIEGTADAKATKIYAEAYGRDADFFRFVRGLHVLEESMSKGDTKVVLRTDGELFRLLKSPDAQYKK